MRLLKYVFWIFITIFLYKLISNIINYFTANYYINKHLDFLAKGDSQFSTYQRSIKTLVERADITATYVPMAQPMGYGYLSTGKINCLDNVSSRLEDVAVALHHAMLKAKGAYRSRILECFSPRYWIELILFFPKHLIQYLGLNSNAISTKILQLLWWALTPIALLFRDQLTLWITDIINQIH